MKLNDYLGLGALGVGAIILWKAFSNSAPKAEEAAVGTYTNPVQMQGFPVVRPDYPSALLGPLGPSIVNAVGDAGNFLGSLTRGAQSAANNMSTPASSSPSQPNIVLNQAQFSSLLNQTPVGGAFGSYSPTANAVIKPNGVGMSVPKSAPIIPLLYSTATSTANPAQFSITKWPTPTFK